MSDYFQGHINAGSPEVAIALHDEMLRVGLEPDRLTYNTLISACVRTGKLDVAMSFYKQLKVARMYLKCLFWPLYIFKLNKNCIGYFITFDCVF